MTVSNLVGRDRRINDVTIKIVPIQPDTVYIVSGSTLWLNSKQKRDETHEPEIASAERLKPYGVEGVSWHTEAGS